MTQKVMLNQRYEIQEVLGHGGFATTYLAVDSESGRKCAVKRLAFRKIEDWKSWELFEREAMILKNLQHPRIPKYLDFFSQEEPDSTVYYLVHQYIEGQSLEQLVKEGKHFTEEEIAAIGVKVAKILEYLHSQSPPIIHRDIKPSNIILTPDGKRVFLIDFGAVRDKMLSDHVTIGGGSTIVGTYGYMPIEQFQGRALPASDIYALGVTLISVLAHKEPSEMEHPRNIPDYRPHVEASKSLTRVLDRMIALNHSQRYQSAAQAQEDLQKIRKGQRVSPRRTPRRALALGAVPALLVLLGLGVVSLWWFVRQEGPPQQIQTPSQQVQIPPQIESEITAELTRMLNNPVQQVDNYIQHSQVALLSHEPLKALLDAVRAVRAANTGETFSFINRKALANLLVVREGAHEIQRISLPGYNMRIDFSSDGNRLAVGNVSKEAGNRLLVFDIESGQQLEEVEEVSRWQMATVGFDPSDDIFFAPETFNGQIQAWIDPITVQRKNNSSELDMLLSMNAERTRLLTGNKKEGTLILWRLSDAEPLITLEGHRRKSLQSGALSPDGTLLASGDSDNLVKIWDLAEGNERLTLDAHSGLVATLAFNADGSVLASGSHDKTIRLWDPATGEALHTLIGHESPLNTLIFSRDGKLLVSGDYDGGIHLWDVATGQLLHSYYGHSELVTRLVFDPAATRVASIGIDGTIHIWDVAASRPLQGHTGAIWVSRFSSDSSILATGDEEGTITDYDRSPLNRPS
jgi:serine/threonine protein kinase